MIVQGIWVVDLTDNTYHYVGSDRHDSIQMIDEIHYYNLQNGDGGGIEKREGYGYKILTHEEKEELNDYVWNKYKKFIYDIGGEDENAVVKIIDKGTKKEKIITAQEQEEIYENMDKVGIIS